MPKTGPAESIGIGPTLQIFGSLVAAVTCWGLFYDEINKFSGGRCTCRATC